MAKRVKGPDGVTRIFPDDATDAEIAAVLDASSQPAYQPRNVLQEGRQAVAAGPQSDDPAAHAGGIAGWFEDNLRPVLEKVARPQTISEIASLLVPDQAGMGSALRSGREMVSGIGRGMSALRRPVAGAMEVGANVLSPGDMLRRGATAMRGAPTTGEAVSVSGYPRAGVTEAPAVAQTAPTAAEAIVPAAAEAVTPAVQATAPSRLATAASPSPPWAAAQRVFETAGDTPGRAELNNVAVLIGKGKAPEEALRLVLSKRPAAAVAQEVATVAEKMPKLTASEVKAGMDLIARGKTPQQAMDAILSQREFLAKMGGGAVTDDAAKAALDLRNARGQIKTPSAHTAELRRGR